MMQLMRDKGIRLKRFIETAIFLVLLIKVFLSVTYLFRNSDYNRVHIIGIKEETLDMVYIGGSDTFVYWEPLKAWNDCGLASYDLATSTMQAESIISYIKHTLTYHKPELFVISARPFQYYESMGNEAGLRKSSDSLNFFSFNRLSLIHKYLNNRDMGGGADILSFYIDIMKYHTNYNALATKANWDMIDNRGNAAYKGFEWINLYQYLEPPENFKTDVRAELSEECLDALYDLLDFCEEEDLNVLFVVCPYQIEKEHWEKYNTMEDIITSYGFDFLNANEYYEEMEIDFSTDFYEGNHVNCYGAEKYTEFLEKYIVEHYDLPDHRGEAAYAGWDENFAQFVEQEQVIKEEIDNLISKAQEGREIADSIKETENFGEWAVWANDSRFTILAAGNEGLNGLNSRKDEKVFSSLGLDIPRGDGNYIRVVCWANTTYTNLTTEEIHYEAKVGKEGLFNSHCIIENSDGECSIVIDDIEYSRQDEGINVVVFENDYHYVVDSVTLKCDENGNIILVR